MSTDVSIDADTPVRPMRADARRNYDTILRTAAEAFAETGTRASLDEIARRACVGPGTLYRHFPDRDSLLAAVLVEHRLALSQHGEELLRADDADAAFDRWMLALAKHSGTWNGLPDTIAQALAHEDSPLGASCGSLVALTQRILDRARERGTVTADLTARELFVISSALAGAAGRSHPDNPLETPRLLGIFLRGLRQTA